MAHAYHNEKVFEREPDADDLKRAKTEFWDKMRKFARRIPFARQAATLYFLVRDPQVDLRHKGAAVLALVYFISPLDMVPDVVPITGLLDDAWVVGAALALLGPLIVPYKKMADRWHDRGSPTRDVFEAEVIQDAEVLES